MGTTPRGVIPLTIDSALPYTPRMHLEVDFIGEIHRRSPGERFTFGRQADLTVDEDNVQLHRVLGRFDHHDGCWWLHNVGRSITIDVVDSASASVLKLAPGAEAPIGFTRSTLRFSAGPATYEFETRLADRDPTTELQVEHLAGMPTKTTSHIKLSDEQLLLLVAMSESGITDPSAISDLPTNKSLAHKLGWTVTKLNRKLDALCVKFDKAGVRGLHGSSGALAKDRRKRLVEHAIFAGIVTDELRRRLLEGEPMKLDDDDDQDG